MIRKAIIENINNKYSVSVRIPQMNGIKPSSSSTSSSNLFDAIICIQPGVYPAYKVGDVVLLGFENDETENPVVLGLLYTSDSNKSLSDISADSLFVQTNITLP